MRSECPFCGFESSVHVVQAHIDRDHTPPSSGLQLALRSPTSGRTTGGVGYRPPASDPFSVRERQIVTRRYPADEPSWIKCGVLGCGMYVPERKMNDHLDMHDMQAEDVQRARRLHEMTARGGGAGFPSSRGQHPSSHTLRRIEWGPMMGDHDYDDISVFSRGSGDSGRGSSVFGGGGGSGKSRKGKRDKHGGDGAGGFGKDGKDPGRKDARRGWSRGSTSGKDKDGKGSGSGKSVKSSSSSSVVTTSSRARSERGGRGDDGSGGGGDAGRSAGGGSGDNGNRGAGGGGSSGGGAGDGNASRRGSGKGGSSSGSGPGAGPSGHSGGSPGGGNPDDPMFGSGTALASVLGGTIGSHGTDMGGLELQLAKLLLANRAGPDAGTGPGAAPSLAPGTGPSNPPGGANSPMSISPAATNEFMQALQKGMRSQASDRKPYGLDQRIPSEAANLLAAIVASRAAGGGY